VIAFLVEDVRELAPGVQIDATIELVRPVVVHDFKSLRVTGRPDPASWLPCSGKAETSTLGPAQAAIPFFGDRLRPVSRGGKRSIQALHLTAAASMVFRVRRLTSRLGR
jgi:hypothetical protein